MSGEYVRPWPEYAKSAPATYVEAALREHSVKVPQTAVSASVHPGRFDHAMRRRAKRSGRETGCWTYISAELLLEAGWGPDEPLALVSRLGGPQGPFRRHAVPRAMRPLGAQSHVTCLACAGRGFVTTRDFRGVPSPMRCPGCNGTGRQKVKG